MTVLTRPTLLAALLCALVACTPTPAPPAAAAPTASLGVHEVTVIRVVDGDTVHVRTARGEELTIRLVGVDSPELTKPTLWLLCNTDQSKQLARDAQTFARDRLLGKTVTLTPDPTQDALDRYGRTLGYLDVPGPNGFSVQDYSTLLADAGLGRAYDYNPRRPAQRLPQIREAETGARKAGRGVWRCQNTNNVPNDIPTAAAIVSLFPTTRRGPR